MKSSIIISVISTLLLVGYIAAVVFFLYRVNRPDEYISYNDCTASSCGNSTIEYPFGTCGLLKLEYCTDNRVVLSYSSFFYADVVGDITLSSYSNRTLRISPIGDSTLMYDWLTGGGFFNVSTGWQLTWSIPDTCLSCLATGGRCYDKFYGPSGDYDGYCICPNNKAHTWNCSDQDGSIEKVMISGPYMAGIFSIQFVVFIIVVIFCIAVRRQCCCKRTANNEEQTMQEFMYPLDSTRPSPSVENFLHYYSSQVPTRYSYTQLRAYTNNFSEQLGKGGFGTVYKGKLPSGRLIAVKILDDSKQSEQQFIAEVATVGSTYHVNLVRMLGYCFERSKRALVYEYIVNGSLDKYTHGNNQDQLDCKQLYSIAVGTARGISYLHEECRNRILHCDIKPHNILLDANFLPKVADFGLAKISNRDESHISAAHGAGTLGYAAPEMWSRMYGPVTDRCDVYSYGMLIMEMMGRRMNIDRINIENIPRKFFYAEWAFKHVDKDDFGNLSEGHISAEDESIAKKLSLVGLWCIQFHASRRPRMSKVIQMLEGDSDIAAPPFPFPVDELPWTTQLSSSDQSSPADQCLEDQTTDPRSTVDTPSLAQHSSSHQPSHDQCSPSYALEVQMTDPQSQIVSNIA